MRRLFLLGGDDWDVDAELDDWWLGLAGPNPTVCVIPTAGGDAAQEIDAFLRTFRSACKEIRILRLFRRDAEDVDAFLADASLVYVMGGNTASMLAVWHAHGVDDALRRAWERGMVVGGVSAAAIAFSAGGITDSYGPHRAFSETPAFVEDSVSPHHDEGSRRPLFESAILERRLPVGYGLDNGVGVLFEGDKAVRFVSARPGARAWYTTPGKTYEIVPDRPSPCCRE